MEQQLQSTERMESIGTLAGGIAHDFNNILGAIIGYTELSLDDVKDRPQTGHSLQQVLHAASRAKDLVGQILSFSRSADIERKPMRAAPVVKEACRFLPDPAKTRYRPAAGLFLP